MGLFGGFKAKFTRNNTAKTKPQEVVCLKYHIHSEFDSQEPPLPVPDNIKKNEVIRRQSKGKPRKPLAKSAIFPESETSNTTLSSPKQPQKSLSMVNLNGTDQYDDSAWAESGYATTAPTTTDRPANSSTSTTVTSISFGKKSEEERASVTSETVAVVTNHHLLTNNVKTEKQKKPILKTFSAHNSEPEVNRHSSDQSTLIFMTQKIAETSDINVQDDDDNFEVNHPTKPYKDDTENLYDFNFASNSFKTLNSVEQSYPDENFNIDFIPQRKAFDEDDDYKVNVVQHDYERINSYSEDEKSYQDDVSMDFSQMGFSSQAASIFFGADVEPVQPRPRRIMLKKDEDENERRSSDADC
ncbi:hypothetical protein NQ317_002706 [Molorchus minor]|uniref:Uncharacterized protein n=1 Tax=Molorchus minor TaxID=1323400 RepID=A0ABQ9K459_9CUCU|nr:hypothetical protein NQ317_002706 [Molorchus minor]